MNRLFFNSRKVIALTVFFFVCSLGSNAQGKANVTVVLPASTDYTRLRVYLDNGKKSFGITPKITNNMFVFESDYYGRYLTVTLYSDNLTGKEGEGAAAFWVGNQPAVIKFNEQTDARHRRIVNRSLKSAIDCTPIYAEYKRYVKQTQNDAEAFYIKYRDSLNIEQYAALVNQKELIAARKGLEYIKKHGGTYSALWKFKNNYADSQRLDGAELLSFFQAVFPDSLKQTFEGRESLKRIEGRINTLKGGRAPAFTKKDINGKMVCLDSLRGKYVLLDFWASWCGPCRSLNPQLKNIRASYPPGQLGMVSLSIDEDSAAFLKAVEEDNPTWTQVLADIDLINSYDIGPVPTILLLDRQGKVIYNRHQDMDASLVKLEEIVSELIGKR